MAQTVINRTDLIADIEAGGTVIAASERLARELRVEFNLGMREAGRIGWAAPSIQSLREWAMAAWEASWPSEQMLHGPQVLALWMYAIEEEADDARRLLSKAAAARSAMRADERLSAWAVQDDRRLRTLPSEDEEAFGRWRERVRERCGERGWLPPSALMPQVADLIERGLVPAPERMAVVGLVQPTAGQQRVLDALAARGSAITHWQQMGEAHDAQVQYARPSNRREQYRAVAEEVRRRLTEVGSGEAYPRLAILVSDMAEARRDLEAELRAIVSPHIFAGGRQADQKPWRFGQGVPLLEHPMVASAMDVVSLSCGGADMPTMTRVLLGPWLFPDAAPADRGAVELAMRRAGGARFGTQRLARLVADGRGRGGDFAASLRTWLERFERPSGKRLASEWIAHWLDLLYATEWGRAATEGPAFEQARDAWEESLDALRAMDSQLGEIGQGQAQAWLREILAQRPFQPSVEHLQPVQILGFEDAAGMSFDWIAVCDATTHALPAPVRPGGFVDNSVLAEHGDPKASPEGAAEAAQQWWRHLQKLAPEIQVYAPCLDETGAMMAPAGVVGPWPEEAAIAAVAVPERNIAAASLIPEAPVPVIDANEAASIGGGAGIVAGAAVSPFVAAMRHRLGLYEFPDAVEGITAREQGELVHRVLELLWGELSDRSGLRAVIDSGELDRRIDDTVLRAAESESLISEAGFGAAVAKAERARVAALVGEWMRMEAQRAYDFEVVQCEVRTHADIAGMRLRLRVDRIDRVTLPDGSHRFLVIDYKTGGADLYPSVWNADRLSEPQLPLYATHAELAEQGVPRVDGIAFGRLQEGGCRFVMRCNFARSLIEDARRGGCGAGEADWGQTIAGWRVALEALARAFMRGDLTLDRWRVRRARVYDDLAPLARNEPTHLATEAVGAAAEALDQPPF